MSGLLILQCRLVLGYCAEYKWCIYIYYYVHVVLVECA